MEGRREEELLSLLRFLFLFLMLTLLGTDDDGATTPDVESIKANCERKARVIELTGTRTYPVVGRCSTEAEEISFMLLMADENRNFEKHRKTVVMGGDLRLRLISAIGDHNDQRV